MQEQTVEIYYPDGTINTINTKRPKFQFSELKRSLYLNDGDIYVLSEGTKVEIHRKDKTIEIYWDKPTLSYCVHSCKTVKGHYFKFSSDGSVILKTKKLQHWWGPDRE
jgi:hypothetical protein